MKKEVLEKSLFECGARGGHCAEKVCEAVIKCFGGESSFPVHKLASGFGGGIGGSHDDVCGALSGGIVALGWLYQDENFPLKERNQVMALSAEFRERFIKQYGSSNCEDLLDSFGPERSVRCKEMTADTARSLFELLSRFEQTQR